MGPPVNSPGNPNDAKRNPFELKTYDMMSFVQKYLPLVSAALEKLTPDFTMHYCI